MEFRYFSFLISENDQVLRHYKPPPSGAGRV